MTGPPIGPPYFLGLHTEEPTRANFHEVTGGSYARVSLAWTQARALADRAGFIPFEVTLTIPDAWRQADYCEALDLNDDEGEGMLLEELLSPATLEYLERVKARKGR